MAEIKKRIPAGFTVGIILFAIGIAIGAATDSFPLGLGFGVAGAGLIGTSLRAARKAKEAERSRDDSSTGP